MKTNVCNTITEIEELKNAHGYSLEESLKIIEVAALKRISECVVINYGDMPYLRVSGSIATYEQ